MPSNTFECNLAYHNFRSGETYISLDKRVTMPSNTFEWKLAYHDILALINE